MAMVLEPIPLPLTLDEHGVLRVTGTRVPIDFIVYDHRNGATTEDITENYPTVKLSSVHAVFSTYLEHKAEVDAYIKEQDRLAQEARERHSVNETSRQLRERLLARREG